MKRILNVWNSTGRLARYHLLFSEFDFSVVSLSGIKYQTADALSRLRTFSEDKKLLEDQHSILGVNASDNYNSKVHIINGSRYNINPLTETEVQSLNSLSAESRSSVKQASSFHCNAASVHISHPISELHRNHQGFLVRCSKVDNTTQIVSFTHCKNVSNAWHIFLSFPHTHFKIGVRYDSTKMFLATYGKQRIWNGCQVPQLHEKRKKI